MQSCKYHHTKAGLRSIDRIKKEENLVEDFYLFIYLFMQKDEAI